MVNSRVFKTANLAQSCSRNLRLPSIAKEVKITREFLEKIENS